MNEKSLDTQKPSLAAAKEQEILEFWEKNKIFEKTIAKRRNNRPFVFFEGPPSANGKPGIHHMISRAFKDLICRYKTMKGFLVERKAGWDTHGLPIEIQTEKELSFNKKQDIEKYGIDKFNQKAREIVWQYEEEWQRFTKRIGFWLDMDHPYVTYKNDYIESIWWILKQIWDKKLLYQDYKVVHYCPRCGTALSSHEVAQGYEDVTETSVYVKFRIIDSSKNLFNRYFLAWTTTPWTLPGNVGLAVGPDIEYVEIKVRENNYILAKNRLEIIKEQYTLVKNYKGKDLVELRYRPLFNCLANQKIENIQNAFRVYAADFVTIKDGTGIVHTAVMYGEDDFKLGEKVKLPKHHTVDENGKFTKEVKEFAGQFVKHSETGIIEFLEKNNFLYAKTPFTHSYPFCWRCRTPLLYYAKNTWFISVTKVKKDLIKNNEKINWYPTHLKHGRFGEWLKEIKDWALSRERYWGTPLPIWQCDSCSHQEIIGSLKELNQKKYFKNIDNFPRDEQGQIDVHRPFIDKVVLKCSKCGSQMRRVKDVIDVWFDSGAMPIAQWHYPFENEKTFKKNYPANYIAEGIDQTRGWFYTLLAISTLLGKGNSYKNVISVGHILDEKGEKMSKSKGNVVDPWYIINKYSNDALRWYLFTVNSPGEPKRFKEKDVAEKLNKFIATLKNAANFFDLYKGQQQKSANPHTKNFGVGVKSKIKFNQKNLTILDKWILSRLNTSIAEVTDYLDHYEIFKPARALDKFVDDLSNWYIRRSRRRFQRPLTKQEKNNAANILELVLYETSKLIAPFTPFVAEEIYSKVKTKNDSASVHLLDYPKANKKLIDKKLEREMELVRNIVALGLNLRVKAKIKVRQPLQELKIKNKIANKDLSDLIREELNIQKVTSLKNVDTLGKNWEFEKNNGLEVALNTEITPELQKQGLAREIIRQIQDIRKGAKYNVNDKILIRWSSEAPEIENVFKELRELIKQEILAKDIKEIVQDRGRKFDIQKQVKINDKEVWIGIAKINP